LFNCDGEDSTSLKCFRNIVFKPAYHVAELHFYCSDFFCFIYLLMQGKLGYSVMIFPLLLLNIVEKKVYFTCYLNPKC